MEAPPLRHQAHLEGPARAGLSVEFCRGACGVRSQVLDGVEEAVVARSGGLRSADAVLPSKIVVGYFDHGRTLSSDELLELDLEVRAYFVLIDEQVRSSFGNVLEPLDERAKAGL